MCGDHCIGCILSGHRCLCCSLPVACVSELISTSGETLTFCIKSISSAIGLSALYLTLFQLKVLRYCSNGSARGQCHSPAGDKVSYYH